MAIAEMSKLSMVGIRAESDAILNAMQRTGAVQIITGSSPDVTAPQDGDRVSRVLSFLLSECNALPKEERASLLERPEVSLAEFYGFASRAEEMDALLTSVECLIDQRADQKAERNRLLSVRKSYLPYTGWTLPLNALYQGTTTVGFLGTVSQDKVTGALQELRAISTCHVEEYPSTQGVLLAILVHHSFQESVVAILSAYAFSHCPFAQDATVSRLIADLDAEAAALSEAEQVTAQEVRGLLPAIRTLSIYADFLSFCHEKQGIEEGLSTTTSTFSLEAYVPTLSIDKVKAALDEVTTAKYLQFVSVPRTEAAPTLMANNKIVSSFEAVTNMYSAPAYGALDPNPVMSVFFSLFMGLIMADVAYGLLMLIGGFLLASRQKKGSNLYRMARVFAIGGIFAIPFGAFFDSWLGLELLRTVIPGYAALYNTYINPINAMSSIMGIRVPSALLWCLGLGAIQIATSLVLKAVQHFRRGQILDGIFGGLVWALGILSAVVWVVALSREIVAVKQISMYIAIGLLGLGILTSGITAKGLGKVTKVFGSAYGLINYISDILSYARLYGLMLSGAQIASIFTNTLALEKLFPQGAIGIIFGVILIIVGNLFNLAMNLLGAYIHDSRLQYVEFFGRFFEGEGDLFTPIGSQFNHIYLLENKE